MNEEYTTEEVNLIIADSFGELNNKEKKYFLAAQKKGADNGKYADALIKSCGAGVYNKLKEKFYDGEFRKKYLAALDKKRVVCVTLKSADYPESLKHIDGPPLVLYARGNRRLLGERMLCVVGSRKSAPQALEECKKICGELSSRLVIATGVADGADKAAAEGALPSGNVVCVLPCGHGYGTDTLRKVEERGLSVSCFPPETRSKPYMFTVRNRILAGLSEGVLVVSAGENGGALSTANYAADFGKDVFAFPYGLGVASGVGCNRLIKSGAYLCEGAGDVCSVLGIEYNGDGGEQLDGDERAVISALKQEGEMHMEKLAAAVGKSLTELTVICAMLEIKGLVVKTGGNKLAAL